MEETYSDGISDDTSDEWIIRDIFGGTPECMPGFHVFLTYPQDIRGRERFLCTLVKNHASKKLGLENSHHSCQIKIKICFDLCFIHIGVVVPA